MTDETTANRETADNAEIAHLPTPRRPSRMQPLNDQVLVRLDVKKRSELLRGISERPTMLPSGVVVAVGRGVFVPGHGFVSPQVAVGDHVALSMEGSWTPLPLSDDPNEVYVAISESLLLGKLEGIDEDSPWFKAGSDAVANVIKGPGYR